MFDDFHHTPRGGFPFPGSVSCNPELLLALAASAISAIPQRGPCMQHAAATSLPQRRKGEHRGRGPPFHKMMRTRASAECTHIHCTSELPVTKATYATSMPILLGDLLSESSRSSVNMIVCSSLSESSRPAVQSKARKLFCCNNGQEVMGERN